MSYPKIKLKKDKERSALHFHPWIFSGAIQQQDKDLTEGDVVEVFSAADKYLGTGHYHKDSITVRLFSFEQQEINETFWQKKFDNAFDLRKQIGLNQNENTTAYRLINAEGDGLPGLIVDIYGSTAVLQTHTIGMNRLRETFANILSKHFKAVYDKSADSMAKQTNIVASNDYLIQEEKQQPENIIVENNLQFKVEWGSGQKTGFFLDQRDNRLLLKQYAMNRKVLNTFCYTGGFSVYALSGDAALVHSVDSSRKAMELTDENIALNFTTDKHKSFTMDVFDFIKHEETVYDLIVPRPFFDIVHQQPGKGVHFDVFQVNYGPHHQLAPHGQRKQRALAFVPGNGNDHSIKQSGGALDNVQMAVGHRIEASRIDDRSHG